MNKSVLLNTTIKGIAQGSDRGNLADFRILAQDHNRQVKPLCIMFWTVLCTYLIIAT